MLFFFSFNLLSYAMSECFSFLMLEFRFILYDVYVCICVCMKLCFTTFRRNLLVLLKKVYKTHTLKCNCSDFLGYLFYCLNMIA